MLMFCSAVVVWSMKPSIVTFGAGAWANTGGARTPRRASAANATVSPLLITASSCIGVWAALHAHGKDPGDLSSPGVATRWLPLPRRADSCAHVFRRPLLQCPPQPGQGKFHPPPPRALRHWVAARPAGGGR